MKACCILVLFTFEVGDSHENVHQNTTIEFKKYPKATQNHSKLRIQQFEDAMSQYVRDEFSKFLNKSGVRNEDISSPWDPEFARHVINVPVKPAFSRKETSRPGPIESDQLLGSSFKSWLEFFNKKHQDCICGQSMKPSTPCIKKSFPEYLHSSIKSALNSTGIYSLYEHQLQAIQASIVRKKHVVVSTSTSSGKSLTFNIPVLSEILKKADSKAIYLFPTKVSFCCFGTQH